MNSIKKVFFAGFFIILCAKNINALEIKNLGQMWLLDSENSKPSGVPNTKYAPLQKEIAAFLPRAILDLKYRFEKYFGVDFNGHIGFADYSTMLGDSGSLGASSFSEMINYRVELAYVCDFVIKKHAFGVQHSLGLQASSFITKSLESNGIRMNLTSENVLGTNYLVSFRYVFSQLHLFRLTYKNTLAYSVLDYTIYQEVLRDDWDSRLDDFNNRIRPGESVILSYSYNF